MESVTEYLGELEDASGKRLWDSEDPLLVSVRSGVAASMPGMMDTVLNLGLNDTVVEGLAQRTGDERFARGSYWRFIQMFGDIVLGIDGEKFDEAFDELKEERGVEEKPDLGADDLDGLIDTYERIVDEEAGRPFPERGQGSTSSSPSVLSSTPGTTIGPSYRKEFGTAVTVMPKKTRLRKSRSVAFQEVRTMEPESNSGTDKPVLEEWVGYWVFITYMSGPNLDQNEPTKSVRGQPEAITASFFLEDYGPLGLEVTRSAETPTIFMSWGAVMYIQGPPPEVRKQIDEEVSKRTEGGAGLN